MTSHELIFWFFSIATLLCALFVVFGVSPVASAMFLVLMFFFMAGLFVMLDAYFLAIIQILVYAGAVMVLFLFVLMLLDVKDPRRWWWKNMLGVIGGPLAAAGFLAVLARVLIASSWPMSEKPGGFFGELSQVIGPLFRDYLLPFEVTALLLLVATVGVVLLGKKETPP